MNHRLWQPNLGRDASNFAVYPLIKGGTTKNPAQMEALMGNSPIDGGFPIAMYGQATLTALHATGVSAARMEAPVVLASIGVPLLDPNHPD